MPRVVEDLGRDDESHEMCAPSRVDQLKKLPKFFGGWDGHTEAPPLKDRKFLMKKRHVNPYYPQPNKEKSLEITMRSSLGGVSFSHSGPVVNGVTDVTCMLAFNLSMVTKTEA